MKNGIHKRSVLQTPTSISSLLSTYGADNLNLPASGGPARVKYVTLAPELDPSRTVIRELKARGIGVSIGHTAATFQDVGNAVDDGAGMITHLFNAMEQPQGREAGVFGALGMQERQGRKRPFFGIITDGVHVSESMVRVAWEAHREGCILVTDAMSVLGCEDGDYSWTNGEVIEKRGARLVLKGSAGKIAGSSATLVECLENLLEWAEVPLVTALKTVTETPARMLGLEGTKGTLSAGADADLVVLTEGETRQGKATLRVDEVWKFGVKVHENEEKKAVKGLAKL